jgi:hypothetical protein
MVSDTAVRLEDLHYGAVIEMKRGHNPLITFNGVLRISYMITSQTNEKVQSNISTE